VLPPDRRERVFSHSSWLDERRDSYERLEFLGDAVLGLAVAGELCRRYPDADEGRLAKLKAHVISRRSCTVVAERLDLGARLVERGRALGQEEAAALAASASVLAALTEAVIGAAFLTVGYERTAAAVVASFAECFDWAESGHVDHKTELQERLQRQGRSVQYVVVSDTGPPHARRFESAALVDGRELGRGEGASKKESEQEAARAALGSFAGGAG
jgi:ribonuclease-3